MSIVVRERCHARTSKRWAKGPEVGRQCKHITTRGKYCWQHEKQINHFRIKKSSIPSAGFGLFTTVPISRDKKVCDYTGRHIYSSNPNYGNPYVLQIRRNNFIDASKTNTAEGRWVNDAKNARRNNTKFVVNRNRAYLKSVKRINAGQEILVPYGRQYWSHFPVKKRKTYKRISIRKLRAQIRKRN